MKKNKEKKFLSCVEQTCECSPYEEVGDPILIPLTKPTDLKNRIRQLAQVSHISDFVSGEGDEEAYSALDDEDTSEVDEFNLAMGNSPYAVDDRGVAKYEASLANDEQSLQRLRSYMDLKDNELFNEILPLFSGDLTPDQILLKIQELGGSGGISQPVDEPEDSE